MVILECGCEVLIILAPSPATAANDDHEMSSSDDELNLSQQPRKNKLRTSASAAADSGIVMFKSLFIVCRGQLVYL